MAMKVKISEGNRKTGKIPAVSLTPIKSCNNCKACKDKCYAMKSYRMYPNVRNAWDNNFKLAKNNLNKFFEDIDNYLTKKKPIAFRYHVSGDIINQKYFDKMRAIARKHPSIKFLAFTKNFKLDFSDIPENLSIVLSIFPTMEIPDINLPKAWVQDGTEKRIPDNAIECFGNCETCGMCWSLHKIGTDVYFHIH